MKSFEDFLRSLVPVKGVRLGQNLMNSLHKVRPDLYSTIPPELDCYYDDGLYWKALEWLRTEW